MIIDRLVSLAYWCMWIGWMVVVPVSLIGFFAGGWFVAVMYLCAYAWIRDLRADFRSLRRHGPSRAATASRVDYLLARIEPAPSVALLQRNGEQDIGNVVGSQDLGYPVVRIAVPYGQHLTTCSRCHAKYEDPLPEACAFCGSPLASK